MHSYGTDLMPCRTREWHALESNLLSTKILSIHHQVQVDALVKYVWKKHLQQAFTEYLISHYKRYAKKRDLAKPSQAPLYC